MQSIKYIFSSKMKIHDSLYKWNNIYINKSDKFINGYVTVNNMKITNLISNTDYKIELDLTNTTDYGQIYPTLCINDMIYYQNKKIFNFDIVLNINDTEENRNHEMKLVKITEKTFNLNNTYSCKN